MQSEERKYTMTREVELNIKMYTEANYMAKKLAESDLPLVVDNIELEKELKNSVLFHDLYQAILRKAIYLRWHPEEEK